MKHLMTEPFQGLQVAPAELEAHLLTHHAVADCAVIPVRDDAAGELPKAYVVKSSSVGLEESDRMVIRDIQKHVEQHKARHKWLKAGMSTSLNQSSDWWLRLRATGRS